MLKTKRFLLTLLVITMCISIAFAAFACKDKENDPTEEEIKVEETLIHNGNFTESSSSNEAAFPHTPSSWTGTPGSTSSSANLKTPQGADDIKVGIIDINKASSLGGNPNKPLSETNKDNKVLMINNIKASSYRFVSKNITLSKEKFYKLTIHVKTTKIDVGGAYITVTGNAYASFPNIDTKDDWKEYNVFFRGSNNADLSVQVSLGLGNGNLETGTMTAGFAYYDLVSLVDLTDVEEGEKAFSVEDFDKIAESETVKKCDLRTINTRFDYASSETSTPYTPSQLTGKGGTGSGIAASTGSSYLEKGIIDIAKNGMKYPFSIFGSEDYDLTKADGSIGDRMLYIYNKQETAYGYKDNLGLFIAKNSYYEISAFVKSKILKGSGATIKLVSSSNTDLAKITDINTNDEWKKVTFYVEGNAFLDNTINIEFWLGSGGKGDGDWVQGLSFFDDLSYSEITKEEYEQKVTALPLANTAYCTLATAEGTLVNITDTTFASTQYEKSFLNDDGNLLYSTITTEEKELYGATQKVLKVTNTIPSAVSVSTIYKTANDSDVVNETNKDFIVINPNTAYILTFCVKTEGIDSAKNASLDIISYDPEKVNDFTSATTSIHSIASINSESLSAFSDDNGYTRYSLYVLGKELGTAHLGFKITLGTGANTMQSAGFVKGSFYLTNIRIQETDYNSYSTVASSTVTFKVSLGGSGASGDVSTNGSFKFVDIATTNSTYKNDTTPVIENGILKGAAAPQGWTISNSKALKVNGGDSIAGVIDVNQYDLNTLGGLTTSTIYNGLPEEYTLEDYPNLLLIQSINTNYLGFESQSISLSAKSYYVFSVFVRVIEGEFTFAVTPSSHTGVVEQEVIRRSVSDYDTNWHQYMIYIKTGISSKSVKVSLNAAYPNNPTSSGTNIALFTMAQYSTIDKAVFESVKDANDAKDASDKTSLIGRTNVIEWYTDTMDTTSTSYSENLNTPSGWTGAVVDSASSADAGDVVKGIFNRTSSDWKQIDIDPDAKIENSDKTNYETIYAKDELGDSILTIYNKNFTTYGYTSSSMNLEANKYYKITVDIMTRDLAVLTKDEVDKDSEKYEKWTDKKALPTATISLSMNNKNYSFGKSVEGGKSDESFGNDETGLANLEEYKIDLARLVNNDGWTTYTFYIAIDKEVKDTVSASLKINLGGKNISYWSTGYVFADNFEFVELTADEFATAPKVEDLTSTNDLTKTNYRIDFTADDATAEPEEEPTEEPEEKPVEEKDNFLWLYITSGVIGALIVIVLVVFIIKKYAPKKKKLIKKSKKTTISKDEKANKFDD